MITRANLARLATATGAELAGLLANAVDWVDDLTDAERLEVVKGTARLDAWTATLRARAIAAVYDSAEAEIAAVSAELAAAAARSSGAKCRLAGPSHGDDDLRLLHRRMGAEVSLVLGVSTWVADREVDLALDLRARPHLMQALADGLLDRAQAAVIVDGANALTEPVNEVRLLTSLLGPDDSPDGDDGGSGGTVLAAAAADPDADPDAFWALMQACQAAPIRELTRPGSELWSIPANRLRTILRREVARLEPAAAAERAQAARSDRRVGFDDQPDFMSELHVRSTTDAVAAAYANIDETARAARRAGDPRPLDQLRADISIGWLTEGAFGTLVTRPATAEPAEAESAQRAPAEAESADRAPAEAICLPHRLGALINVAVAATTAIGLDDEPAILHGPSGPIPMPAELARELAHSAQAGRWRRILYDPGTGVACDVSAGYRAPPRLDAFVRARDGFRSRLPTSMATHLELDHVREFDRACPSAGGQTRAANLASLGQRDHHLKTDRVLRVSGDANSELTITTSSGRRYVSEPHRYADPPF